MDRFKTFDFDAQRDGLSIAKERGFDPAGRPVLTGYASVFDEETELYPGRREVIMPGAFSKSMADGRDKFAFWSHDHALVLGSTRNNTLSLWEDERGLGVMIALPDTQAGRDAALLVSEGYVGKMSFGFEITDYEYDKQTRDLMRIYGAKLYEVSPVPIPAYDGTSVTIKSGSDDGDGERSKGPVSEMAAARWAAERERLNLALARYRL